MTQVFKMARLRVCPSLVFQTLPGECLPLLLIQLLESPTYVGILFARKEQS